MGHDPFLDDLPELHQRTKVLGAFAQAMRDAWFSRKSIKTLASSTVRSAVDNVAQTFRDNDRDDPRYDKNGKPSRLLSQQYKGYKNADPNERQQKALPASVLHETCKDRSTVRAIAVGQLAMGAYFFAMRSCEYTSVTGSRRTKLLTLHNFRFFRNKQELQLDDPFLLNADAISITFEFQKSNVKNETVTLHPSGESVFCPVRSWATVIQRIQSYPKTNNRTPINTIFTNRTISQVTGNDVLVALRGAADIIGSATLGFPSDEIGTHSIRSGAAMAMHLDQVPVYTIMMIGRWSSDAFLRYIRKQVEQFSQNISSRIAKHQAFNHIPNFVPQVSHQDPLQRNHKDNAATRTNVGGVAARAAPSKSKRVRDTTVPVNFEQG